MIIDKFGVKRARTTVHNGVQKADLQPTAGGDPNQVAFDETVVRLNDESFWLLAALDAATNHLFQVQLFPTRTTVTTRKFLDELREKYQVEDAPFLVDRASWFHAASIDSASDFDTSLTEI